MPDKPSSRVSGPRLTHSLCFRESSSKAFYLEGKGLLPEALLSRGIPTRPKAFLELPGMCAGQTLKTALCHTSVFGGVPDE